MKKIMFNDRYSLTKAVLEVRKTQTRRIIPDYMQYDCSHCSGREIKKGELRVDFGNGVQHSCRIPYKVGEIVAVAQCYKDAGIDPNTIIKMKEEGQNMFTPVRAIDSAGWTNKMFVRADLMPHHIKITGIDLERLQDISDEDCLAEGVLEYRCMIGFAGEYVIKVNNKPLLFHTPRKAFAALIDKVSGKGTWESNPWVVVYDYKVVD